MINNSYLSKVSLVIPSVVADMGLIRSLVAEDSMNLFDQIIVVISGVDPGFEGLSWKLFSFNCEEFKSLFCLRQGCCIQARPATLASSLSRPNMFPSLMLVRYHPVYGLSLYQIL